MFYPTVAQRVPGETNLWRAQICGCVFEFEKRRLMVAAFEEALEELKTEELTAAQSVVFSRASPLVLSWITSAAKRFFVRCGTNEFFVGKSGADGRFGAAVVLSDADLERRPPARRDGIEQLNRAVPEAGAPSRRVHCAPMTIATSPATSSRSKPRASASSRTLTTRSECTEVRDKSATLLNTFLREFQPVPGMAEFYQKLAHTNGAAFHYISASPWQLYEPLAACVASNGFPAGTFELKQFRWKDRSFFSLFARPEKYKPGVIEPFLKQFPKRKFILIGDSGRRDPGDLWRSGAQVPGANHAHLHPRRDRRTRRCRALSESVPGGPARHVANLRQPVDLSPTIPPPHQF